MKVNIRFQKWKWILSKDFLYEVGFKEKRNNWEDLIKIQILPQYRNVIC